jgi:nuclear RNA export factor
MYLCQQQHLMSITLTGVFREPSTKGVPVRHFVRKFVLVPIGTGFCIINEMLFVTNASSMQIKNSFNAVTMPVSSPVVTAPTPIISSPQQMSTEDQQRLIEGLSSQTNMNLIWARK